MGGFNVNGYLSTLLAIGFGGWLLLHIQQVSAFMDSFVKGSVGLVTGIRGN